MLKIGGRTIGKINIIITTTNDMKMGKTHNGYGDKMQSRLVNWQKSVFMSLWLLMIWLNNGMTYFLSNK